MEDFIAFLIGAGVIYLFWRGVRSNPAKKMAGDTTASGLVSPKRVAEENNMSPEASAIHKAATAKIARAKELGLPEIFEDIYFEEIKHFPAWAKKKWEDHVPAFVEKAVEFDKQTTQKMAKELGEKVDEHTRAIELQMNGKSFLFFCESHGTSLPDGDYLNWEVLQMFVDKKKVLVLDVNVTYGEWKTTYRTSKIDGFIEGDWIQDIKQLYQSIKALEKKRSSDWDRKQKEEEAEKMKKNFGL